MAFCLRPWMTKRYAQMGYAINRKMLSDEETRDKRKWQNGKEWVYIYVSSPFFFLQVRQTFATF